MLDPTAAILAHVSAKTYQPVKPKVLAKLLKIPETAYPEFRTAIKGLLKDGRLTLGKNNVLRPADQFGAVLGTYRRTNAGHGFVRPAKPESTNNTDVFVRAGKERDAATGDTVMVRVTRRASGTKDAAGEVVRVVERATRSFVGTYFERDGKGYVKVDGTVFAHSVAVGDAGAKGVKAQDKVVVELLTFPTSDDRGEGVISEVLGPLSQPGVDRLSIVKAFGLPEAFPEEVLADARAQADKFRPADLLGRKDFTQDLVITVDPVDAKDFDDAVSVEIDPKTEHWVLTVHIADVAHFAPPGSAVDTEAKKRGTSVYLPQFVIPMFPEIISNGLASLQAGVNRYVKTVRMEFTPALQKGHVEFFNGVINARQRFAYEQVQAVYDGKAPPDGTAPETLAMLHRLRDLAKLLRKKRFRRGSLELTMPEPKLEFDADGRVTGAHFAAADESHSVIEECMLAANEAVAEKLTAIGVPFLRRVHPAPKEDKLEEFARFAGTLGYPVRNPQDRYELQRLLDKTAALPERAAIHYALLRSLKQATYSPVPDQHYALASDHYCHFTSPIRRYPDLTVHRLLDRIVRTGKAAANEAELKLLGDQCSRLERRAEQAERELIKLKILQYLTTRIGEEMTAVITGVAEYGFFAQADTIPAEGLVHVSSLTDDYYHFDADAKMLKAGRGKTRYRLGDRVKVKVARVDVPRRMLDFRLAVGKPFVDPAAVEPRRKKRE